MKLSHKALEEIDWKVNPNETAKLALGKSIPAFVVEHMFMAGAKAFNAELEKREEEARWEEKYQFEQREQGMINTLWMMLATLVVMIMAADAIYTFRLW